MPFISDLISNFKLCAIFVIFQPLENPENSRFFRRAELTVAFGLASRGAGDLFSIHGTG